MKRVAVELGAQAFPLPGDAGEEVAGVSVATIPFGQPPSEPESVVLERRPIARLLGGERPEAPRRAPGSSPFAMR